MDEENRRFASVQTRHFERLLKTTFVRLLMMESIAISNTCPGTEVRRTWLVRPREEIEPTDAK